MSRRGTRQFAAAVVFAAIAISCVAGLAVADGITPDAVDLASRSEKLGIVGFLALVLIASIAALVWLVRLVVSDLRALVVEAKVALDHAASAVVDLKAITLRCALAQQVALDRAEKLANFTCGSGGQ